MTYLDGVKVLDLTHQLSGPFATMLLADMGADVYKIEPPGGDPARKIEPAVEGTSLYFASVNRNKRSLVIDLKTETGRRRFLDMVDDAAAVVHNFRPGVMERLGLGEEALRARNPSVILCAISGYGESGPYRDYPAYDLPIQALSGLVGVTGEPGGPPIKPGISLSDEVAGLYAALGLCAAIAQRNASGVGDYLEVSLLDCSIAMLTYLGANYLSAGIVPGPIGTHHPSVAPWGCYPTRDGHIAIAIWGEAFWRSLCEVLGKERLLIDPRFATNGDRVANRTALEDILRSSFHEAPTEVWLERLRSVGVPAAPVNRLDQTFSDPQVLSRDLVLTLPTRSGKGMRVVGNPIKGRGVRRSMLPAPELDEFTEQGS